MIHGPRDPHKPAKLTALTCSNDTVAFARLMICTACPSSQHMPWEALSLLLLTCRIALFHGLIHGCYTAQENFKRNMRGDPEVREPLLDFFGISVKANEVPAHSQRMEILERKVSNPLWSCGTLPLLCLCRLKESGPSPSNSFHV